MGFHAPCEASWAARQHLHAVWCAALVVGCLNSNLRVVLLLPVGGKRQTVNAFLQLSATDVSAQTTMKGAAKCDKHCDLQNSVNQQGLERILRFRDTPESMPASVSTSVSCFRRVCLAPWACASSFCRSLVSVHQGVSCKPLMHQAHWPLAATN